MTTEAATGIKLELGAGKRPTPGYEHCDLNPFEDIEYVAAAWDLDLPDESVQEVLALGLMEHLTYDQFEAVLANVHRMLQPGGRFFFDVPDLPVWAEYLVRSLRGESVPFDRNHIYHTIYGWQRWPGDEHHSGWDLTSLDEILATAGFAKIEYGVGYFLRHGLYRDRFLRPKNAHIYVVVHR